MPPNQKARHKTPLSSSMPHKNLRSLQNSDVGSKIDSDQCQGTEFKKSTNAELKFPKKEPEEELRIFTKSACLNSKHRRKKALTTVEKIRALNNASSFESENPFFMVIMQPSYVRRKCYLVMPIKFTKRHLKKECGVVKLEALDGRTWPARYEIPRIKDGWKKFVMENGLKVGQVCVFELIGRIFKVHIFGDKEEVKSRKKTCSLAEDLKVNPVKKEQISSIQETSLEKASSFKPKYPHFMVKMTHNYIWGKSNLHVPVEFARIHLRDCNESVKLVVQDVAWPVEHVFRITLPGTAIHELSLCGWKQFCQDNELKVGDVCIFELIPDVNPTFRVTILRATEHVVHSTNSGRYGRCLSNPVSLKPPDGKEWRVYWTKRDNEFWFQKGWKEFANFYSLDDGFLVLFKYEGTSQLHVHIIDKSALEIDYPLSRYASSQEDNLDNLSDDIIDILDETTPSPEASQNAPLSSSRPHKKMRSTADEDVEMSMPAGMKTKNWQFQGTKFQKSINADLKFSKQKSEGDTEARIFDKNKCLNSEHKRKKMLTDVEKNKALESAISFKSDNPYFMMVMQPSYVSPKSYLPIPKEFARKHLKEECEVVQLKTLDGRIWHAKYNFPKIGEGWRKFVKENGLEVGHVCVFEMIDLSLKVHIFRDAEKVNLKVNSFEKEQSSSMQDPPLEKGMQHPPLEKVMQHRPLEKDSSSQPENPHFMYVPIEFAKAHLRNGPKSVTLIVQDKDWTVGYAFRSYDKHQQSAQFSWGWKQFCKDNDLKVGDVCDFELTEKFRFQVGARSQYRSL
ncbi:B3 domain-containing protein Os03g0620400-like [Neltuma alba]|uniref:B3 domain-containing protein Os03g0620400-like n=1 Tax=Neltuma alba TaxID=207710 RepID=UPI0010A375C9|nr:B3 domain-containing protein Os03g0620400-like [Prosopis alba]